jgi:hypothetical protein
LEKRNTFRILKGKQDIVDIAQRILGARPRSPPHNTAFERSRCRVLRPPHTFHREQRIAADTSDGDFRNWKAT